MVRKTKRALQQGIRDRDQDAKDDFERMTQLSEELREVMDERDELRNVIWDTHQKDCLCWVCEMRPERKAADAP